MRRAGTEELVRGDQLAEHQVAARSVSLFQTLFNDIGGELEHAELGEFPPMCVKDGCTLGVAEGVKGGLDGVVPIRTLNQLHGVLRHGCDDAFDLGGVGTAGRDELLDQAESIGVVAELDKGDEGLFDDELLARTGEAEEGLLNDVGGLLVLGS